MKNETRLPKNEFIRSCRAERGISISSELRFDGLRATWGTAQWSHVR